MLRDVTLLLCGEPLNIGLGIEHELLDEADPFAPTMRRVSDTDATKLIVWNSLAVIFEIKLDDLVPGAQEKDRLLSELPDTRRYQNLGELLEKIAECQDELGSFKQSFVNKIGTLKEKAKVLA